MAALRWLWRTWSRGARRIGRFNTLLVLTVIYFLLIPLFALWRLRDPLRLRPREGPTQWIDRSPVEQTAERFTHPY
jgi:hypothetical protein